MSDLYDQDQNEPTEPTEPSLGIGVYPPAGEQRRISRTMKIVGGGASAVVLALIIGVAVLGGGGGEANSATPSRSAAPSAPSTPSHTPLWTPSSTPSTVEPFIPPASTVWSSYLTADERADVCAKPKAEQADAFNQLAYDNVRDITDSDQYTTAQVAAAMDCPKPKPAKTLTEREMTKVAAHPDSHVGESYVIYGMLIQYDPITGSDAALAVVSHRNTKDVDILLEQTARLTGEESDLEDFIDNDFFKATVTVSGSYQYTTKGDGEKIIPEFTITSITRTGHWN